MASLATQTVNNQPAIKETQVWSQGQEDPLEKGGVSSHSRRGRKGVAEGRQGMSLEEDSPGGFGESESREKDRAGDSSEVEHMSWTCLSAIPVLHLSDPHSLHVMTFLAQRSHRHPTFLLQLLRLQQRTLWCREHHWHSPPCSYLPWTAPSSPASHQSGTPLPTPASRRRNAPVISRFKSESPLSHRHWPSTSRSATWLHLRQWIQCLIPGEGSEMAPW